MQYLVITHDTLSLIHLYISTVHVMCFKEAGPDMDHQGEHLKQCTISDIYGGQTILASLF